MVALTRLGPGGYPIARITLALSDSITEAASAAAVVSASAGTAVSITEAASASAIISITGDIVHVSLSEAAAAADTISAVLTTAIPTLMLPGLTWPVHRRPTWRTVIVDHPSGGENRTALWQFPLWEFEIAFDGLSVSATQFPNLGAQSYQTLLGFYLTVAGSLGVFLYRDQIFNAQTGGPSGTGDGVTTTFPFVRVVDSAIEPASWVTGSPTVYVNGTAATGWTLVQPNNIVFASAPTMGAVITADFEYSFLCRFLEDTGDYEQLMINLFEMKSLKFRQVRTT